MIRDGLRARWLGWRLTGPEDRLPRPRKAGRRPATWESRHQGTPWCGPTISACCAAAGSAAPPTSGGSSPSISDSRVVPGAASTTRGQPWRAAVDSSPLRAPHAPRIVAEVQQLCKLAVGCISASRLQSSELAHCLGADLLIHPSSPHCKLVSPALPGQRAAEQPRCRHHDHRG